MGINNRKQQLELAEALMAQGVEIADPARIDIRGELTCGKGVFIDINAVFEGKVVARRRCENRTQQSDT